MKSSQAAYEEFRAALRSITTRQAATLFARITGADWTYGTVLRGSGGYERISHNKVMFLRYLPKALPDGRKGFQGVTIVGDRDAVRLGRLNRIDQFPVDGWVRDE